MGLIFVSAAADSNSHLNAFVRDCLFPKNFPKIDSDRN